jgi:hypothetical protein
MRVMVASRHGERVPGIDWVEGLVVTRATLDTMGQGIESHPPVIKPSCSVS